MHRPPDREVRIPYHLIIDNELFPAKLSRLLEERGIKHRLSGLITLRIDPDPSCHTEQEADPADMSFVFRQWDLGPQG